MESILTVEHLFKSFGDKTIFSDLKFGINKGQKVALVGRNGEGKSTLLNMLFYPEQREKGTIVFNSDAHAVYLPQKTWKDENISIQDEVYSTFDADIETLETFWARAKEMLYVFGIRDLTKKLSVLSGGEQKKVALAKVLLKDSNFYVLDEPTNHLDIDMIRWMENYLKQKRTTLLIVTHDRDFIDNVCTDIYELYKGQINKYHGNFEYFLEKKEEFSSQILSEIGKAKNLYARELDWINRMPQARGTKSKKRIENFDTIKEKAFQSIDKPQEKLAVVEKYVGKKILEINSISKSFEDDKPLIRNFSYTFKKGDKIAIIGRNGCGKSTLLDIIAGLQHQDSGTIIKGETIDFGYYRQMGLVQREDKRVIDIIRDVAESITTLDKDGKKQEISASNFLTRFGFNKDLQFHYYSLLSGGEKRRLYLLKTLIKNPNFLILDEPTNDLDIYSLLTLEEFLIGYRGCLLLVSHDRRFVDNVSGGHSFIFGDNGTIKDCYVPYAEYLKEQRSNNKQVLLDADSAVDNDYEEQKRKRNLLKQSEKLSFKEKRALEDLEKEIPILEQEKRDLTEAMSSGKLSNEELQAKASRMQEIIGLLDEKEMQWLDLQEKE